MSKSPNHNRLDAIEIQLSPKEWAIRLGDEFRHYRSGRDFLRAVAKGTYREAVYIKPYFALAEQAKARHPGKKPQDISARCELSRKLRTEYHSLKLLINRINDDIDGEVKMCGLKARALANQLHMLILRDAFTLSAQKATALIQRSEIPNLDEQECQLTLRELTNVVLVSGSRSRLLSLAREWADDACALLMQMMTYKTAVERLQEKYFDGHTVLYPGVGEALENALRDLREIMATFNQYVNINSVGPIQNFLGTICSNPEIPIVATDPKGTGIPEISIDLTIDYCDNFVVNIVISKWEVRAKDQATAAMLQETGEHENFVWNRLREMVAARA